MKKEGKHLHIYMRVPGRKDYYMCMHPDCTHYTHKSFLLNKRALCYFCHEPFIISRATLRLAKLRCENCKKNGIKSQEEFEIKKIQEVLEGEL